VRIVLDTNVLVSGLLSPFGPPGDIVRMVASGAVILCVDARVLAEYADVLRRTRFGFDADAVATVLDYIESSGEVAAAAPLPARLPDHDDEAFLEVAVAANADFLVTGNLAHFPADARRGVAVVTPSQFMDAYREASRS
jgi:putative PIN family toxin of toxin-antitoxin system